MIIIKESLFRHFFTTLCITCVLVMVLFWCHKFWIEDREIGVVDYVPFKEALDIDPPVASICIEDPFLPRKILETNTRINNENYLKYLKGDLSDDEKGDLSDEDFRKIDYAKVTIDLRDYVLSAEFVEWDEHKTENASLHYKNNFNGIIDGDQFFKCYEINFEIDNRQHLQDIIVVYDRQRLLFDMDKESLEVRFAIHYPGQFLLATNGLDPDTIEGGTNIEGYIIKDIEILRSSNSRRRKCTPFENMATYDDMVKSAHIKYHDCIPPYFQLIGEFPRCSGTYNIRNSSYNYDYVRKKYFPVSCRRISKMAYDLGGGSLINDFWSNDFFGNGTQRWSFLLSYPEYVKIISVSKDIDVHALIGNIGGYVGLFLGTAPLFYV